ncbi:MAG: NAD(P)/FAD-dependent oxidoreductase [Acidobacteria bacterium]|nr:NAD(P)/FAD-dependent oxidoreductase [Acidobacteriota bacterium]
MTDVVVIGGGHNGLAAAFYLAKAGLKPVVLEARDTVGGGAITSELHPGFTCPTLSHHTSLWTDVVRDMHLTRHGVDFLRPTVETFAPDLDGPPVIVYQDARRTAEAMRRQNPKDAEAYPAYRASVEQIAAVVASALVSPAPSIDSPDARDVWNLFRSGRKFRALGKRNSYRLLRWTPMPVADLAREWFESEVLCASIAGPAVSGTMLGPRSAGSGLMLLLLEANRLLAGRTSRVRGGPGALTQAMAAAARAAGADIRTATRVERIVVKNERVSGVVADGREIPAAAVVSAVDPKTTFLRLMDPADLMPDFLLKIRNYRAAGTVPKVNLALATLPSFSGPGYATGPAKAGHYVRDGVRNGVRDGVRHGAAQADLLSGRIHIGPSLDYLERAFDHAKYGELSTDPWLDVTIPSVLDPALAPPGAHVMSIYAHYAPYRLRDGEWRVSKDLLLSRVLATLERFAPGLGALIVATQVITPLELETDYGFHGGHIFHGELALDQLGPMRPLLGHARHHGPVRGLYLCSAGTHPGGFMTGASGKLAAREVARAIAS